MSNYYTFWLLVSLNFSRTLMILIICLTFVGQAMASAVMPYQMMSMTGMSMQGQSNNMSMMDHSSHSMTSDVISSDSEESSEDCCTQTCNCYTSGCSTVAALIKDVSTAPIVAFSAKINSLSHLAQSQQQTSLYRPPILS